MALAMVMPFPFYSTKLNIMCWKKTVLTLICILEFVPNLREAAVLYRKKLGMWGKS
jgi:hypothetical protein